MYLRQYLQSLNSIIDMYSEANKSSDYFMYFNGFPGSYPRLFQSFPGNGNYLNYVKLYLKKQGSPTGNSYVKIYAHSGVYGESSLPTGDALAVSAPFDISTLTTTYGLKTFTFSGVNKIKLEAGTKYVLVLDSPCISPANCVSLGGDSSSPTHGGNMGGENYLGHLIPYPVEDMCFYVYS
jgi:hypothetical protein